MKKPCTPISAPDAGERFGVFPACETGQRDRVVDHHDQGEQQAQQVEVVARVHSDRRGGSAQGDGRGGLDWLRCRFVCDPRLSWRDFLRTGRTKHQTRALFLALARRQRPGVEAASTASRPPTAHHQSFQSSKDTVPIATMARNDCCRAQARCAKLALVWHTPGS